MGMAAQDQSIVDLLKAALSDAQELIQSELALVKAEVRQEVSRFRAGIVAFAGAAVAAIVAVVLLAMTIAWGISEGLGWPVWAGFGSVAPKTTRLKPAAMIASVQGGVRP
jgi:hypothetical protein